MSESSSDEADDTPTKRRFAKINRSCDEADKRFRKHEHDTSEGVKRAEERRKLKRERQRAAAAARAAEKPPVLDIKDAEYLERVKSLEVLGLSTCDDFDVKIRSKFKELALQWHPDKNPMPEAGEIFKRIRLAYETLIFHKY